MTTKGIIFTTILTILIGGLIILTSFNERKTINVNNFYRVFLDGEKLGVIANEQELLDLINEEQFEIKEKFDVDNVYPPNGFVVQRYRTYDNQVISAAKIYSLIKDMSSFTIRGYIITIGANENKPEPERLYVLDTEVWEEAIRKTITAFVTEEELEAFSNGTVTDITEGGQRIENIFFDNRITIKESTISVDEHIYTDVDELAGYLLFGTSDERETYVVESGDTIETIAYEHELSTVEFLIANPRFTDKKNLLAIGEEVTIALIHPIVDLVLDIYAIQDIEIPFETITRDDATRPMGSRTVTPGQNGIQRVGKKIRTVNGVESQEGYIDQDNIVVIREPVPEIVVRGTGFGGGGGTPPPITGSWGWPTNIPYIISSGFGWRGGSFHAALDITGTGWGSPIFAINDGVVIWAGQGGGWLGVGAGIHIWIDHQNGYFSQYAHLASAEVSIGQQVRRGQRIGRMGNTGRVSPRPSPANPTAGTHLHFAVHRGTDVRSSRPINPWLLYR